MTTHLCLVSAQVTPNLTPLIDPAVRPEQVILAVSADMRQRADWLEQVIRPRGIKVSRWAIDDPYDIEHTREQIEELLLAHPDHQSLLLNATGGTKPMSIAAYEVFRRENLPIFYVHPEKDRLIWLHPEHREAIDLADRLKLEEFLAVHGARLGDRIRRQGPADRERDLCDYLIEGVERFSNPLRALNWLASTAESSLRSQSLGQLRYRDPDLDLLLDRFAAQGFLRLQDDHLRFTDEADRFFVNGGWLELHAFDLCAQLRRERGLQDLGRNVRVERNGRDATIPNELDVAALVDNRLHILECKAKKWDDKAPGAEALYRLDTLKDLLGGLNARAMLVSYQPLPDHDRQRAADLNIQVCAGRDLQRLREKLQAWFWPR